jgi:polysaccharide export outer membrane protein
VYNHKLKTTTFQGGVWFTPAAWLVLQAVWLAVLLLPTALRAQGVDGQSYHLAPGDRIAVTVFGQPELSGDAFIGDNGTITIPLLDSIKVEGLTLSECQKRILDRLADGILQKPSVSVRIAELRPISVLGDVRLPGAYPFRYGSTVQSAVALAGGYGPGEAVRQAAVSEYLSADERVRQLTLQQGTLLVREARLKAESEGKDTFSPPALPGGADDQDTAKVVQNEMNVLSAERAILQDQIKLLHSQKPHLRDQISANTEQSNAEKKQLDVLQQQADYYDKLVKQGLGTQNNNFQYHILESTQAASIWRLQSDISRLQEQSGDLDFKIEQVEAAFKQGITKELHETRDRLHELEVTLPAAVRIRDVRFLYAGGAASQGVKHSIQITRMHDGKAETPDANETTPLEPGDIIDVKIEMPQVMQHQAAAGPSGETSEAQAGEGISPIAR